MADQNLRLPPHSEEAEASVLGAVLIDKYAIVTVAEMLTAEDFYDLRNNLILKPLLLYMKRDLQLIF